MNNLDKDKKLKKDLEIFVKNKIADVKCVDEALELFKVSNPIKIYDLQDAYRSLRSFKIGSQLILNLYNDFKAYEKLCVRMEGNGYCKLLESCYEYDNGIGLWRCRRRPTEEVVVEILFNYIIYFESIKKKECIIEKKVYLKKIQLDNCVYCDEALNGADVCGICNATYDDMINSSQFANGRDVRIETEKSPAPVIGRNEGASCVEARKCASDRRDDSVKEVVRSNKCEEVKGPSCKIDTTKWKCGRCGLFNEYASGNCEACEELFENGSWNCEQCTKENSGRRGECDACYEKNDRIRSIIVEDSLDNSGETASGLSSMTQDDEEPRIERWECGGCRHSNVYEFTECGECGAKRCGKERWSCKECTFINESKHTVCKTCRSKKNGLTRGQNVKSTLTNVFHDIGERVNSLKNDKNTSNGGDEEGRWKCGGCGQSHKYDAGQCSGCDIQRSEYGRWECSKCTCINKCSEKVCMACGVKNDYFGSNKGKAKNKSASQKINKQNNEAPKDANKNQSQKWPCRYLNCKNANNGSDEYCTICGFDRNFSDVVGETIGKKIKNSLIYGWVCPKCTKFNDVSINKCGGAKCDRRRYDKIECISCATSSDVWTEKCERCGEKL